MSGLMEAHQGVDAFLTEGRFDFIGAEGAVAAQDVAAPEAMAQLAKDRRLMGALRAFDDVFPAAVGVIEHAHDAHERKAAAGFLAGGLRIYQLVGAGVVEGDGPPSKDLMTCP